MSEDQAQPKRRTRRSHRERLEPLAKDDWYILPSGGKTRDQQLMLLMLKLDRQGIRPWEVWELFGPAYSGARPKR
jgi:hypothetical protein